MDFNDILNQWDSIGSNNNQSKKKTSIIPKKNKEERSMDELLSMYPPDESCIDSEHPKPTERQKRRNYRRMKPQEIIDLHGCTLFAAKIELDDFLERCKKRKIEKILIIHGKGLHSPEGESVLRNFIRGELKSLSCIGEIGHPSEKEGGAGATWAIIKY